MKSPIRILLVEDDSTLLQTLAEYFRSTLLAIVYTAISVPEAIAEIDLNGPFDVMVSDYQMPPHTANDLVSYLRERQDKTPYLIQSSFTGIDESKFDKDCYMGLIAKPGHRELVKLIGDRFPHAKKT